MNVPNGKKMMQKAGKMPSRSCKTFFPSNLPEQVRDHVYMKNPTGEAKLPDYLQADKETEDNEGSCIQRKLSLDCPKEEETA
jgi:hypothetical protein